MYSGAAAQGIGARRPETVKKLCQFCRWRAARARYPRSIKLDFSPHSTEFYRRKRQLLRSSPELSIPSCNEFFHSIYRLCFDYEQLNSLIGS
jgi:hypothetical protein